MPSLTALLNVVRCFLRLRAGACTTASSTAITACSKGCSNGSNNPASYAANAPKPVAANGLRRANPSPAAAVGATACLPTNDTAVLTAARLTGLRATSMPNFSNNAFSRLLKAILNGLCS